ncbi:PaaI family thioesterase [Vibrio sp. CDRSL-10 TSBA]
MDISHLTGQEHLNAIINGDIPPPTIFATMGMSGLKVEEGNVVIECRAAEQHCNPMGGVHGGFAATVLDSVTGCAVHSMLKAGISYGTIDLAVKMLRPIPQNETLIAQAKVTHISRFSGCGRGHNSGSSRETVCQRFGSATCFIINKAR